MARLRAMLLNLAAAMPVEDQITISRWADETFGQPSSILSTAIRANQEMAELLETLIHADLPEPIVNWIQKTREAADELRRLAKVHRVSDAADPMLHKVQLQKASEEAADVVIVLARLFERAGVSMETAVDRKMVINRGRTWKIDADGHAQHVKESAEERARISLSIDGKELAAAIAQRLADADAEEK